MRHESNSDNALVRCDGRNIETLEFEFGRRTCTWFSLPSISVFIANRLLDRNTAQNGVVFSLWLLWYIGVEVGGLNVQAFNAEHLVLQLNYGLGIGVLGCSTDIALIILNTTSLALGGCSRLSRALESLCGRMLILGP